MTNDSETPPAGPDDDARRLFALGMGEAEATRRMQDEDLVTEKRVVSGYTILRLLGRGGMGVVYLALQNRLERTVALKVMPNAGVDVIGQLRFEREAKTMARLQHPNIVTAFDLGVCADGSLFIAMECVAGKNLSQYLKQKGPLPLPDVLRILDPICRGLDYAHGQGVVHRDIKPANILLAENGDIKISDFGIAKLVRGAEPVTELTRSGALIGTPAYMAPEQRDAEPVDARTDVFSLGVMTYEMLTGKIPHGSFDPPSALSDVSEEVDAVVEKAMRASPGQRYANVAEFRQALERATSPGLGSRTKGRQPLLWFVAPALLVVAVGIVMSRREARPTALPPTVAPSTVPAPVVLDAARAAPNLWVDVLSAARPGSGTASGDWERTGEGLVSGEYTPCTLILPVRPGDHYDAEMEFTRLSGTDSVALFFSTGAHRASFELDAWRKGLGGVQNIDGQSLEQQADPFMCDLENGRRYLARLEVRGEQVRVYLDDEQMGSYRLAGAAATLPSLWIFPDDVLLGLGSWEARTVFHRVRWRPVSEDL